MMLGLRAMVVFYLDKRGEEKKGEEKKGQEKKGQEKKGQETDCMIQH